METTTKLVLAVIVAMVGTLTVIVVKVNKDSNEELERLNQEFIKEAETVIEQTAMLSEKYKKQIELWKSEDRMDEKLNKRFYKRLHKVLNLLH